ncbi:hypothetical protein QJQ45_020906, partial [Haematococcus lacustris]
MWRCSLAMSFLVKYVVVSGSAWSRCLIHHQRSLAAFKTKAHRDLNSLPPRDVPGDPVVIAILDSTYINFSPLPAKPAEVPRGEARLARATAAIAGRHTGDKLPRHLVAITHPSAPHDWTVLVALIGRDVAAELPWVLLNIEREAAALKFATTTVMLVSNDNADGAAAVPLLASVLLLTLADTQAVFTSWASKVAAATGGRVRGDLRMLPAGPRRSKKSLPVLAEARNVYLAALEEVQYQTVEWLLVVDTDMCTPWPVRRHARIITDLAPHVDVLLAHGACGWYQINHAGSGLLGGGAPWHSNSAAFYCDNFALRSPTAGFERVFDISQEEKFWWVPGTCRGSPHARSHLPCGFSINGTAVGHAVVEVAAAFGGWAMYRANLLRHSTESVMECEHVSLNKCLREQHHARQYVATGLVVEWEGCSAQEVERATNEAALRDKLEQELHASLIQAAKQGFRGIAGAEQGVSAPHATCIIQTPSNQHTSFVEPKPAIGATEVQCCTAGRSEMSEPDLAIRLLEELILMRNQSSALLKEVQQLARQHAVHSRRVHHRFAILEEKVSRTESTVRGEASAPMSNPTQLDPSDCDSSDSDHSSLRRCSSEAAPVADYTAQYAQVATAPLYPQQPPSLPEGAISSCNVALRCRVQIQPITKATCCQVGRRRHSSQDKALLILQQSAGWGRPVRLIGTDQGCTSKAPLAPHSNAGWAAQSPGSLIAAGLEAERLEGPAHSRPWGLARGSTAATSMGARANRTASMHLLNRGSASLISSQSGVLNTGAKT